MTLSIIYFSVYLFNEFLLLQVLLVLCVCFFFLLQDSFFLLINAIFYLTVVVFLAWLLESDIYINFLLIIDLGVFFVLLGFLLNLVSLFADHSRNLVVNLFYFFYFIFFIFLSFLGTSLASSSLPFLVSFYDWYTIFNLVYFTDLQLLSDIYYIFVSFEFIIMNFYLYWVILVLYILRQFTLVVTGGGGVFSPQQSLNTVRGNFMRTQDIQSQLLVSASVRVWSR